MKNSTPSRGHLFFFFTSKSSLCPTRGYRLVLLIIRRVTSSNGSRAPPIEVFKIKPTTRRERPVDKRFQFVENWISMAPRHVCRTRNFFVWSMCRDFESRKQQDYQCCKKLLTWSLDVLEHTRLLRSSRNRASWRGLNRRQRTRKTSNWNLFCPDLV